MFFKLLVEFKTSSFKHLLSLTAEIYNQKIHRAHGYPPMVCHNDTHIASLVSRSVLREHLQHREESKAFFERNDKRNFSPGDKVLIKVVKKKVQKQSNSVFFPNYTQKIYTVKDVDRTKYPPTYSIEEISTPRRFYEFELQLVDPLYHELSTKTNDNFLTVEDVEEDNSSESSMPYLRSGRTPLAKSSIVYRVRKKNKIELLTEEQLRHFKNLFGSDSLRYSAIFQLKNKRKYVI